jgi:penicillin-binding protein 1C
MHEPLRLSSGRIAIRSPHFVLWLLSERTDAFNATDVRTTLDVGLQTDVEQIVATKLQLLADKNVTSAAVVVLDARTGDILAMVGSGDYFDAERDGAVNVALSARQPGSALKPFTYALAFEKGLTPATTVADVEVQYRTEQGDPYLPRNYDYEEHGLVRLRESLANSYNIAAVRVLEKVGVAPLLSLLKAAGITTLTDTPEHYGLALTLGDGEVKLLELASAYGIFARGGRTLVTRSLLSDPPESGKQVVDPKVAWLIADILSDPEARLPQFSGNGPLSFDVPVAAKTGTTRNSRDNWTVGFTSDRIVGVWVGNADNSPMRGTSGVTGAGPIFHDVMMAAIRGFPPHFIDRPDGIVDRTICRLSGKLPTDLCTDVLREHFIAGSEPTKPDDMYQSIAIDSRNNLLADTSCPASVVRNSVFTVFPLDLQRWARERGFPIPPTTVSPLCGGTGSVASQPEQAMLEITLPRPGTAFRLDPLIPLSGQNVTLEARAGGDIKDVHWFVDGVSIGTALSPDFHFLWLPILGAHEIEVRSGALRSHVTIEVTE